MDTLPRFEGRAWLAVADTSGGYHRRYGEWRLPSTDSVEIMLGDSMDRVAMELARTSQGLAGIAEYITDVVGPPRRWQINAIREDCDVARRERSNVSFKLPGE